VKPTGSFCILESPVQQPADPEREDGRDQKRRECVILAPDDRNDERDYHQPAECLKDATDVSADYGDGVVHAFSTVTAIHPDTF